MLPASRNGISGNLGSEQFVKLAVHLVLASHKERIAISCGKSSTSIP